MIYTHLFIAQVGSFVLILICNFDKPSNRSVQWNYLDRGLKLLQEQVWQQSHLEYDINICTGKEP